MRKVDIPDDLAIAIEEVKQSYGLRTFTAAVHLVLKRGCPLVLNGATVQPPQPIASKPATPPELTPVEQPRAITPSKSNAIASVTSLPEHSASRADRLKRL